jgi:beta-glucosidase
MPIKDAAVTRETAPGLEPLESRLALSAAATAALESYVGALYQDLLHRAVDPAGEQYWMNQIARGATLGQIASTIAHSNEHFAALVETTYQDFLGRGADPAGLNFWVGARQAGLTDEQLEAGLLATDEFYRLEGGTDADFVAGVYQTALQRAVDPQGEAFWEGLLAGGISRLAVSQYLAHSAEREQLRVEDDYANVLHRQPDPAGVAHWTARLLSGASNEDVLSAFTSSRTYFKQQTGVPYAAVPVASELGWWQGDVQAINARAAASNSQLLFLGDSITANWTNSPGAPVWNPVYGSRNALQAGIFGDETQGVLWRLEHSALAILHPKAVVLMIGTNNLTQGDSPADVAQGIQAVVDKLREIYPNAQVLLMGILPRGATANDPMRQAAAATNQLISGLADGQHVQYFDIGPSLLNPDGTFRPGVMLPGLIHIDTIGYQYWAAAIEPSIRAALA